MVNYEAENTDEYKNNEFNSEAYGALAYNTSLPMFKKNGGGNKINFLTPRLSLRYAPGHMRDLDNDNLKLVLMSLHYNNENCH